jgi:hypothetical protein
MPARRILHAISACPLRAQDSILLRTERGCVADQPQQVKNQMKRLPAAVLRLVEDDTAALRRPPAVFSECRLNSTAEEFCPAPSRPWSGDCD